MRFYRTLEAIASNPNGYDGMFVGQTLFRHCPYIEINTPHYLEYERYYAKDAHTISYKLIFREKPSNGLWSIFRQKRRSNTLWRGA